MYSNLPLKNTRSNSDGTVKSFENYYDVPVQLDQNTLTAMIGWLESKGFQNEAAEIISITILTQARRDNINPMTLLESVKQLDQTQLSRIVAEILNYNRFKTSTLGVVQDITPVDNVKRTILL